MRMRFCAMMRSPAFSIMALIAPVMLRAVASGLRIEKVRSIAISHLFDVGSGRLIAPGYLCSKLLAHRRGGRAALGLFLDRLRLFELRDRLDVLQPPRRERVNTGRRPAVVGKNGLALVAGIGADIDLRRLP